jgi:hypothetical protein
MQYSQTTQVFLRLDYEDPELLYYPFRNDLLPCTIEETKNTSTIPSVQQIVLQNVGQVNYQQSPIQIPITQGNQLSESTCWEFIEYNKPSKPKLVPVKNPYKKTIRVYDAMVTKMTYL